MLNEVYVVVPLIFGQLDLFATVLALPTPGLHRTRSGLVITLVVTAVTPG